MTSNNPYKINPLNIHTNAVLFRLFLIFIVTVCINLIVLNGFKMFY